MFDNSHSPADTQKFTVAQLKPAIAPETPEEHSRNIATHGLPGPDASTGTVTAKSSANQGGTASSEGRVLGRRQQDPTST